ncbi:MAG TPA: efflux RND transporter periplasmic adaptor subunit, partial [Chloroflexota bacterium]|nr:efflux RND transporter periplasmic adaptor subunit [Chloroflexota bacterium]
TAVANAQQSLADAQKVAQSAPAVVAQSIEKAKDQLYADQVADDAAVGRGSMTKRARQAALDADQAAVDAANASAQQTLAQSQQTLNQAQQALKTAQANQASDQAKVQGSIATAQAQVNTAQSTLASTQAKDAQTVQSAQSAVATAQSGVQTAQANYNNAAAPPTQDDIAAAKSQVDNAQAALTLAQNNLNAATLVAPTAGTVTAVNGAVGQWLAGGAISGSSAASANGSSTSSSSITSDFIDLTSLTGLQITSQVNEADISKVQVGQPITFTTDAFAGQTFTGKVTAIQPLGQTTSNVVSYSVISNIDPTDAKLLPGMTASVSIVTAQASDALEVPVSAQTYAKTHGASGKLVEMQAGKAVPVAVTFGLSDGKEVQVTSGVAQGDTVVTGGGSATAAPSASSAAKTTNPLAGGSGPGAGGPPPGA